MVNNSTFADYTLGPGDIVKVKVYDHEDLTTETRVNELGAITFPLLGEIQIGGATAAEAETRIATRLEQRGFVRSPHVNVTILQYNSQQVSVLGFVNKPGRYALDKKRTVTELLAMAGGASAEASDTIVLLKNGQGKTEKREIDLLALFRHGDSTQDLEVTGGDVIYVPRASVFYIYGEVQRSGAFRLERNMNVAQALSMGGGLTTRGTERGIAIKRQDSSGAVQTIKADLLDRVQKDDVIYVPERLF